MNIEDKLKQCIYFPSARTQRKNERERGIGDVGTETYEKAGCYDCGGLNTECDTYVYVEPLCSIKKILEKRDAKEFYKIDEADNILNVCYYECLGLKVDCEYNKLK